MAELEILFVQEDVDMTNPTAEGTSLIPAKSLPIPAVGDQVLASHLRSGGEARLFVVLKRTFVYQKDRLIVVVRIELIDDASTRDAHD